jgi:hypothetical protein
MLCGLFLGRVICLKNVLWWVWIQAWLVNRGVEILSEKFDFERRGFEIARRKESIAKSIGYNADSLVEKTMFVQFCRLDRYTASVAPCPAIIGQISYSSRRLSGKQFQGKTMNPRLSSHRSTLYPGSPVISVRHYILTSGMSLGDQMKDKSCAGSYRRSLLI